MSLKVKRNQKSLLLPFRSIL